MAQQIINEDVLNFICDAVNTLVSEKELHVFFETSRGIKYVRDSNSTGSIEIYEYWDNKYNEEQKEQMCEIIYTCINLKDTKKEDLASWVFIEGLNNNIFLVTLDHLCFFMPVPDDLVKELRQFASHENRLIYARNEFQKQYRDGNVHPLKKYKMPGRASARLECPPSLLSFLDQRQEEMFSEKNVIKRAIEERILYKGDPIRISVKKGCEAFLDAVTKYGRDEFLDNEVEKAKEQKYMEYVSGAQFYVVDDKVFVEVRLGFQSTVFKVPKRLHKVSLKYAEELNILVILEKPIRKTQQTM